MGLTFDGLTIPGIVEPWSPAAWDLAAQYHTQFGLKGGGVLFGGQTTRTLSVPIWVKDEYSTYVALMSMLASIDDKVGHTGSLVETSGVSATYPLCHLERLDRRESVIPPNSHIGWSQKVTLQLRQLSP